jgi:ABC-type polysaccharide/polyol phosphate export permease
METPRPSASTRPRADATRGRPGRFAAYRGTFDLTQNLVLREMRSRYKRSILGWSWSLINPLATVAIYWVVFSQFLKVLPPVGNPSGLNSFVLFLLCGLLPYRFISEALLGTTETLVGNANLIKKVYFPRELFVVSAVCSLLVTFLIELSVLSLFLLIEGNMVLPWIQACFVLGIGFILAPLNVYLRDVKHFIVIAVQLLFYTAPVVYPLRLVPKHAHVLGMVLPLRSIYVLNPLAAFIGCYRDILYNLRFPPVLTMLYLAAWAVGILFFGHWVFGRLDRRLAEEV